jgi:hypothetical protein
LVPVVLNGGQIQLTITNGGVYYINSSCSSSNDGLISTCINPSNLSSYYYTLGLNNIFPGGLYFNLQNCSS